jgi:hypothetical protein
MVHIYKNSTASHPSRPDFAIYTITRFKPNLDGISKPPRNQASEFIFLTRFHFILNTVKFMVIRVKEMYMTHNKLEIFFCKMTHYHSREHRCRSGVDVKLGNGVERERVYNLEQVLEQQNNSLLSQLIRCHNNVNRYVEWTKPQHPNQ